MDPLPGFAVDCDCEWCIKSAALPVGWFNECSEALNENEIARTRLEESPEEKRRDGMMLALRLGIMQLPSLVVIASTDDNYDNRPLRDALHLPFRSSFIASSHHRIIFVLYYYSPQSSIRCLLHFIPEMKHLQSE